MPLVHSQVSVVFFKSLIGAFINFQLFLLSMLDFFTHFRDLLIDVTFQLNIFFLHLITSLIKFTDMALSTVNSLMEL